MLLFSVGIMLCLRGADQMGATDTRWRLSNISTSLGLRFKIFDQSNYDVMLKFLVMCVSRFKDLKDCQCVHLPVSWKTVPWLS